MFELRSAHRDLGEGVTLPVLALDDVRAQATDIAGAKAAALARARGAQLPALPGFVITTDGVRALLDADRTGTEMFAVHDAWQQLSERGARSLVVRSSSPNEDGASQSMAGMFTSVLDVRDWPSFLAAVDAVAESAHGEPIAALVQPFLQPAWGGVLFGADPVTGRSDRLVVAAVPGGPDRLVSGQVDGAHLSLSPRGRLLEASDDTPAALRDRTLLRPLAALAARARATFGGPQDIEWAIETDGTVVLLQSRPITAVGDEARAAGPVLGPGPVAETFGLALRPLEEDLWVSPLREALREALTIAGATPARQLRSSPIVVTVGGRVAVDLDLLGLTARKRSVLRKLDPRPPARRLKAAWRVGRLKVALPALAEDLIERVDADLRSLPDLSVVSTGDLLRVLRRSHQTLVSLHGHEVLAGLLLDEGDDRPTAASSALRLLANRPEGFDDAQLVAAHPVLLSLVPPHIGSSVQLPPAPRASTSNALDAAPVPVAVRESLRLRVRWVQEVTARAAIVLGQRLVARGVLSAPDAIVQLRLDEVPAAFDSLGSLVFDLREVPDTAPPLPASFRLTEDGVVVPFRTGKPDGGKGAGGGRGSGPVHIGAEVLPQPGDVLVVRTLDPGLAALLPGLGGLVAETGSVLSHLAILAREYGVPTVVGKAGATEQLSEGTWVVVDGSTGEVSEVADGEWGAA